MTLEETLVASIKDGESKLKEAIADRDWSRADFHRRAISKSKYLLKFIRKEGK